MMELTLLIIKPDATAKRAIGDIISMVEDKFEIRGIIMKTLSREEAEKFYAVHRGKPFYNSLVEFMTSGPVVGLLLAGEDAIRRLREVVGATDPSKAAPGTIRAKFGTDIQRNAVHASDSKESAEYEIPFFFK